MTDHIVDATQKVIDLDALEKLARAVSDSRKAYSLSEDGSVAESQAFMVLDEAGKHLDAEGDPADLMLVLIAELKEAREHLARCVELVPAPGAIEAADAFLARNGKGEG